MMGEREIKIGLKGIVEGKIDKKGENDEKQLSTVLYLKLVMLGERKVLDITQQ
jgi:hypothetical protein